MEEVQNYFNDNSLNIPKEINFQEHILFFKNENNKDYNNIEISNEKNMLQIKRKRGRKKLNSNNNKEHNKFSQDNLFRKIKYLIFTSLRKYDNDVICKVYDNNIGKGIFTKQIFKINHQQIFCSDTDFNRNLLDKTQGEILSENITTKFSNYPLTHNKDVIEELLNESDEEKRKIFIKLFNKTFLECIKHIRGSKKISELEGLEKVFKKEMNELHEETDYINELKYLINNYEEILYNKIARKKKENNNML
jgi:hypothetical protein